MVNRRLRRKNREGKNKTTEDSNKRVLQLTLTPVPLQSKSRGHQRSKTGPNKVKTPTKGYTKRLQLIGTSPEKPAPVDTSLSGYSRLSLPDVRSLNRQRRSPKKRTETVVSEERSFSEIKVTARSEEKQEWIDPSLPGDVEVPVTPIKYHTGKECPKQEEGSDTNRRSPPQVKQEKPAPAKAEDSDSDCAFVSIRAPKIKRKPNPARQIVETVISNLTDADSGNHDKDSELTNADCMTPNKENSCAAPETAKAASAEKNPSPTAETGHDIAAPKKRFAFDKSKLSSAFMKLKSSGETKLSRNGSNGKIGEKTAQSRPMLSRTERAGSTESCSSANTDNSITDLIPPETPRPLDFELDGQTDTSRAERKKNKKKKSKRRHRSGDSSSDGPLEKSRKKEETTLHDSSGCPAPSQQKSTTQNRSPLQTKMSTDNESRTDLALIAAVTDAVVADKVSSVSKVTIEEPRGLKRTARKTVNRTKNMAKEMEMVKQFKQSQHQPSQPLDKAKPQSSAGMSVTATVTESTRTVKTDATETVTITDEERVKRNQALVLEKLIPKKKKPSTEMSPATIVSDTQQNKERKKSGDHSGSNGSSVTATSSRKTVDHSSKSDTNKIVSCPTWPPPAAPLSNPSAFQSSDLNKVLTDAGYKCTPVKQAKPTVISSASTSPAIQVNNSAPSAASVNSTTATKISPASKDRDSIKAKWAKSVESYASKQKVADEQKKPTPQPTAIDDLNAKSQRKEEAAIVIQSSQSQDEEASQSQPNLVIDTQKQSQSSESPEDELSAAVSNITNTAFDEPIFSPLYTAPPSVQAAGPIIEAPPSVPPPNTADEASELSAESEAEGALSITDVRTLDINTIDPNFTPSQTDKHIGEYKFPNGARVVTIYKGNQLHCAVHELVIKLKLVIGDATQVKCTPEEGNRIRNVGRVMLKENFDFKLVPLDQVHLLLAAKGIDSKSATVIDSIADVGTDWKVVKGVGPKAAKGVGLKAAKGVDPKAAKGVDSNAARGVDMKSKQAACTPTADFPSIVPNKSTTVKQSSEIPSVSRSPNANHQPVAPKTSTTIKQSAEKASANRSRSLPLFGQSLTVQTSQTSGKGSVHLQHPEMKRVLSTPPSKFPKTVSADSQHMPDPSTLYSTSETSPVLSSPPAGKSHTAPVVASALPQTTQTHNITAVTTQRNNPITAAEPTHKTNASTAPTLFDLNASGVVIPDTSTSSTMSKSLQVVTTQVAVKPSTSSISNTVAQSKQTFRPASTVSTFLPSMVTSNSAIKSTSADVTVTSSIYMQSGASMQTKTSTSSTPAVTDDVIFVGENPSPSKKTSPVKSQMIKLPCVDEFAHFSGDHKSMHSTLQQLLHIKIAVSHVKVLIGKNKAYKGELIANIEVYNTNTPFLIRCSMGCNLVFGPLDFMLHLEDCDRSAIQKPTDLWIECIVLDQDARLVNESQVVFWNTFVDWFQLKCGGAKITDSRNLNQTISAKPTETVAGHNSITNRLEEIVAGLRLGMGDAGKAAENLSYLDEIPASPAPYKQPQQSDRQPTTQSSEAKPAVASVAVTQAAATARRTSATAMNPPPIPTSSQSQQRTHSTSTTQHRAKQLHRTVVHHQAQQQQYNTQNAAGMMGHYYMAQKQTHPHSQSDGTRGLVLEKVRTKCTVSASKPAVTNAPINLSNKDTVIAKMMDVHSGYRQAGVSAAASVYMQNPIQSNNTGLLTSRQPSPNVMVNPAQQHGAGTMSPALSASPPMTGVQSHSDMVNQAMIQKTSSIIGMEAAFKMMEEEIMSLKSQLSSERREKQDYAIKLSKAIAESQAKDQQIHVYNQQLQQLQQHMWGGRR